MTFYTLYKKISEKLLSNIVFIPVWLISHLPGDVVQPSISVACNLSLTAFSKQLFFINNSMY